METFKICAKCKESKETSNFCKNKFAKSGFQSHCKSCRNAIMKVWKKENYEKYKEQKRRSARKYYQNNKDKEKFRQSRYVTSIKQKYTDLLHKYNQLLTKYNKFEGIIPE